MSIIQRYRAQCVAVGASLPERVLSNHELEQMVDTSDEWIRVRTGIRERRILAPDQRLSSLALAASQDCLAQAGVSPDSIDGIIVATSTADQSMPAMANVLQHALGCHKAWGYDLVNACNGFLAAICTASAMVESGRLQRCLVVAGDAMSPYIDWSDRNTCILFGDGCGAVLIEAGPAEGFGIIDWLMGSDGSGGPFLCIPASGSAMPPSPEVLARGDQYLKQDGRKVFHHAIRTMTASCQTLMSRQGLSIEEIDLFIPHQANIRIINGVGERLQLRPEQIVTNLECYGNTTAATVPLAIADCLADGRLQPGSRLLITTFGAGFAWGAMYLTWGRNA